jgi:hypothetical protein
VKDHGAILYALASARTSWHILCLFKQISIDAFRPRPGCLMAICARVRPARRGVSRYRRRKGCAARSVCRGVRERHGDVLRKRPPSAIQGGQRTRAGSGDVTYSFDVADALHGIFKGNLHLASVKRSTPFSGRGNGCLDRPRLTEHGQHETRRLAVARAGRATAAVSSSFAQRGKSDAGAVRL